jgi:ribosomal protein L5
MPTQARPQIAYKLKRTREFAIAVTIRGTKPQKMLENLELIDVEGVL